MDIRWWHSYIKSWNGTALLYERSWTSSDVLQLYITTDASSNYGAGGIYGTHWYTYKWNDTDRSVASGVELNRESVPWYELRALVIAASTWGHQWCGKRIRFITDCQPIVSAVNRMSSHSNIIMDQIRTLAATAAHHNFEYHLCHIAGASNNMADALSRGQVDQFKVMSRQHHMDDEPTTPIMPSISWQ